MPLPDATLTILDGGAGLLPDSIDSAHVVVGVCSSGTGNALAGYSDVATLKAAHGAGPAVEAACAALVTPVQGRAPRPVYVLPVTTAAVGTYGAVTATRVASSTGVVATAAGTSTPKDSYECKVKITRAGIRGTAAFSMSFDGGNLYEAENTVATSGVYTDSLTGVAITFDTGTFEVGDIFTFAATEPRYTNAELNTALTALLLNVTEWSFLHIVGTPAPEMTSVTSAGTSPPVVTITGTPTGYWNLRVEVTTGGARGTAVFRWSTDGGTTWTSAVTTAATTVLASTGLTLAWATGTDYATDNVYTAHGAKAFRDRLDTCKTQLAAAEVAYRYGFAMVDAPDASDAVFTAATLSLDAVRVGSTGGMARLFSANSARRHNRPANWSVVHRIAAIDPHTHPGQFDLGSLADVVSVSRDERQTTALDAQRYSTLRTHIGQPGIFVTRARLFAAAGSDFVQVMNRRVMDKGCRTARAATLRWLNKDLRVNPSTSTITAGLAGAPGTIDERDARAVEQDIAGKLEAVLLSTGNASAVAVQCNRTDNILSTATLKIRVRITPKAYAETIETTLSFVNPAFQTS